MITISHKTNHTVGYNLRLTTRLFSLFPARKSDMRQGKNFMSYDHCMLTVTRRSFCVILGNELGLHKYLRYTNGLEVVLNVDLQVYLTLTC